MITVSSASAEADAWAGDGRHPKSALGASVFQGLGANIGTLIIRIRFWGPLYDKYTKEPQNNIGNSSGR